MPTLNPACSLQSANRKLHFCWQTCLSLGCNVTHSCSPLQQPLISLDRHSTHINFRTTQLKFIWVLHVFRITSATHICTYKTRILRRIGTSPKATGRRINVNSTRLILNKDLVCFPFITVLKLLLKASLSFLLLLMFC